MTKLEVKYYKFWYRLLIGSGFIYAFVGLTVLRLWIVINSKISFLSFSLFDLMTIPVLIILFIICYRRTIYYLSSVDLGDQALSIKIHKYDKINKVVDIEYHDLDIEIYLNLLSKYNNYRLVFSKRSNREKYTFDIVHKQFEIGYWKRSKLKELFTLIREKQGKLSNTDHIK